MNPLKDPKTTMTGLVTGVMGLLSYFDVIVPEAWLMPIILVGSIALSLFAGDAKKKD